MDIVKRRVDGKAQEYKVYPLEEAIKLNLNVVPWKQARVGDWCLTDDNWVTECIRKRNYVDRDGKKSVSWTFSFTRVWSRSTHKLEYLPLRFTGRHYSGADWQETEAKKTRTKNVVKVYVKQILQGKVDFSELGRVYRPDQKIPAATVRRLFRQDRIKEMIDKELDEIMAKRGLTREWVMATIKRAVEVAELDNQPASMLKGADMVAEYLEIKPDAKAPKMIEAGFSRELIESIDSANKELEPSKEVKGHIEVQDEKESKVEGDGPAQERAA